MKQPDCLGAFRNLARQKSSAIVTYHIEGASDPNFKNQL